MATHHRFVEDCRDAHVAPYPVGLRVEVANAIAEKPRGVLSSR
jgi:hypothetical protein